MAQDRTNMVSLLDIGSLFQGQTADIEEMGDGFTELSEDWSPDVKSTQYVNMAAKSSTLNGYDFSMKPEKEYLADTMQTCFDGLLKKFPTGKDAETYYYRFFKTDLLSGVGDCIKVPVIVAPSSAGGKGGDVLTTGVEIHGNGDVVLGTITIASGKYTWAAKS